MPKGVVVWETPEESSQSQSREIDGPKEGTLLKFREDQRTILTVRSGHSHSTA